MAKILFCVIWGEVRVWEGNKFYHIILEWPLVIKVYFVSNNPSLGPIFCQGLNVDVFEVAALTFTCIFSHCSYIQQD